MPLVVVRDLVTFWTVETSGFFVIYRFANQFFAGALVPLWFFPPALRTLADLLPFQTQAHLPLAIYFGMLTGPDLLRALGIQAGWVVILALLARWLWGRAYRRLVIQGG